MSLYAINPKISLVWKPTCCRRLQATRLRAEMLFPPTSITLARVMRLWDNMLHFLWAALWPVLMLPFHICWRIQVKFRVIQLLAFMLRDSRRDWYHSCFYINYEATLSSWLAYRSIHLGSGYLSSSQNNQSDLIYRALFKHVAQSVLHSKSRQNRAKIIQYSCIGGCSWSSIIRSTIYFERTPETG